MHILAEKSGLFVICRIKHGEHGGGEHHQREEKEPAQHVHDFILKSERKCQAKIPACEKYQLK